MQCGVRGSQLRWLILPGSHLPQVRSRACSFSLAPCFSAGVRSHPHFLWSARLSEPNTTGA